MDRIKIVRAGIVFSFLVLGLGILNLSVLQGAKFRDLSNRNCIRLLSQQGSRGKILDCQGQILVDNNLSYDVFVLPYRLNHSQESFKLISRVLGVDYDALKKDFKTNLISSSLPVLVAKNIDIKKAMIIEELKLSAPEIIVQPRPQRHYPYGKLACHAIGYVNEIDRWRLSKLKDYGYKTKDMVGFGGVEEKYDYYLRQEEGGSLVEVDSSGRFKRLLGFRQPRNGRDIQLTIDLRIQKIVEDKLAEKKGSVVIMEPFTGEIIALASSPGFDPSVFVNGSNLLRSRVVNSSSSPLLNRAISSAFPAGSIFKLVVATAALETKKMNLSKTFFCQGTTRIGSRDFVCWNTHNQQNLIKAIAHSCNIFFYRTGLLVGPQAIYDYALKLGLSRPTSFDLPYEVGGFVPSPLWRRVNQFKNWYDGDTANLAIGQGELLVTPLQITRLMAVFANGGWLVTPHIDKSIDGRDISIYQKRSVNLNLKKDTLDYIRKGLRQVILDPEGTAQVLSDLEVNVAGKTGTAQAPPGQPHAWFIGYLPFQKPKFVICVFLERAGPGYLSCLLARQIIKAMLQEGLI